MSARVTITSHPIWRLRATPAITRGLLWAAAIAGLVASARFAVAPPRPPLAHLAIPSPADLAGQGFATLFARRYLTWDAERPDAHQQGLASFVGNGMDPDAGMRLPPAGHSGVVWAEVVQSRAAGTAEHVYTVAAQTDAGSLVYLSVPVRHPPGQPLSLAGYPAFVGGPAVTPAVDATQPLADVDDAPLATVVSRSLGNYLAGSSGELAADLAPGSRVAPPNQALALERIESLKWSPDRASVLAQIEASDQQGALSTLTYEIDVQRAAGRWQVSAIEMDPTA